MMLVRRRVLQMELIRRLATGNHERLERGMEHQYRHDRIGVRLLLVFGLCWCFFLGWPMTWIEFMAGPMYFYGLLRLTNTWRIALVFLTRPLVVLVIAFFLWNLVTYAWTPDRKNGLDDLSKIRFFIAAAMLWSVMDSRRWLIAALAAGFLVGNAVQFADMVGSHFGIAWLDWQRPPDRHSGWWKPAVAGSLIVGALGLHLPAAFMGRGRVRWIAIACASVTLLGLLATGTRGAWIAAAGLLGVTLCVALGRDWRRRAAVAHGAVSGRDETIVKRWSMGRRAAVAAISVAVLAGVGVAGWRVVGPSVMRRVEFARQELRLAWEKGDYSSFTGQRLLMWELSIDAFAEHPLAGVGVGGYEAWTTERRRERPRGESGAARDRRFPHAHNSLLHAAATTGAPGLVLLILIIVTGIRGALDPEQLGEEGPGSYAAGPGFALIGLLLISVFDTVQANAPTTALISTLLVMCLLPPPKTPAWAAPPQCPPVDPNPPLPRRVSSSDSDSSTRA